MHDRTEEEKNKQTSFSRREEKAIPRKGRVGQRKEFYHIFPFLRQSFPWRYNSYSNRSCCHTVNSN